MHVTILVTGGTGYVGSHTCVELLSKGHSVILFDNLRNSHREVLGRMKRITGMSPIFVHGDVRDEKTVADVLTTHRCTAVIHFAGLKSVADSVRDPLGYYDNNVVGTLALTRAMQKVGVRRLVFSSSATVYGKPQKLPLDEHHPTAPSSPYGKTKLLVEEMLTDLVVSNPDFKVAILRYFNPVGAHESGLIGEDPIGIPNNLMPFVAQVAVGRRPHLVIFGSDYETSDGTGVRDYVHVIDIACGHLRALEFLDNGNLIKVNLGTGHGTSVLELTRAFSKASNREIPIVFAPRRDGDVACCYASVERAFKLLNWRAVRDVNEMCRDAWNWQNRNPDGYF
jgi:UDP-glucose 4-epimerase